MNWPPTMAVTAGRDRLWPIHFWPSWFWPGQFWPICAKTNFGQILANPFLANPIWIWCVCVSCWAPKGGPKPRKSGAPKIVHPKEEGRRVGGPKFRVFFFPLSRSHFRFFCLFLWGSSRGILCLKRRGLEMCPFGLSGCRVKPRRPQIRWGFTRQPESPNVHFLAALGPPGLHTTAREPKRAHFRVPAFKNTTKFQRKDPQERKKE